MTNVVVLCYERYQLTMQCINSIRANTKEGTYTLTLVDDDSKDFRVRNFLRDEALYHPKDTTLLNVVGSNHCLGALKNLGVWHSEMRFGRGDDGLVVMDNDMFVFQNWLEAFGTGADGDDLPVIIGGVRHPFHQVNKEHDGWVETDAVAGYCHAMTWLSWQAYGPYNADASGIGQSEDFAICRRAVEGTNPLYAPDKVGYADPPVMAHCGITNSRGELIAGHELIERIPGVLYL